MKKKVHHQLFKWSEHRITTIKDMDLKMADDVETSSPLRNMVLTNNDRDIKYNKWSKQFN